MGDFGLNFKVGLRKWLRNQRFEARLLGGSRLGGHKCEAGAATSTSDLRRGDEDAKKMAAEMAQ